MFSYAVPTFLQCALSPVLIIVKAQIQPVITTIELSYFFLFRVR